MKSDKKVESTKKRSSFTILSFILAHLHWDNYSPGRPTPVTPKYPGRNLIMISANNSEREEDGVRR